MAGGYSQGASKETRNCCHTENQKRKSSHAARGYKRVQSGATPVMEDTGKHVKVQIPKAKALFGAFYLYFPGFKYFNDFGDRLGQPSVHQSSKSPLVSVFNELCGQSGLELKIWGE